MILLRLLKPQGIAGLVLAAALAILLLLQKGETRHWKKQSEGFEKLYRQEQTAFAGTVANYRAAAVQARAADAANLSRVATEQRSINERTKSDYQTRIAAAHAVAERLRGQAAAGAADPGAGREAPVPGLSAAAGRAHESAGQDRLPDPDRLLATEQAIQLDELIKWVRQQHAIRVDGMSGERPSAVVQQHGVDPQGSR